ncbi:hypothetical protein DEIPH_ctg002orf0026 [Deinococcus phoenicis]|uniref:Uncharacterized protein n=1 Tax=Deinococcus phoenicis TaxID=1476583 RepID=A0A016QV96_9DEIO|nr:hypothetical protein [Deinococcus phoenicis]EYB69714.1 hypothetical protein DEIPH_ctg002orf0026 [Deinococcus phoenicis]
MTGRRDEEQTDVPLPQRSTDSESATQPTFPTPQQQRVVQDSPGTPGVELEGGSLLDDQGNYKRDDNLVDPLD